MPKPANLEVCLARSKPRGIRCARKLRLKRKKERWADAKYAKRNSGNWIKANPFAGSSHAKGIVLEKMCAPAPRPSAAAPLPPAALLRVGGGRASPSGRARAQHPRGAC
eukprot:COSAG04_NODE_4595_length_1998_cov_2.546077_2_plen_109_part_00